MSTKVYSINGLRFFPDFCVVAKELKSGDTYYEGDRIDLNLEEMVDYHLDDFLYNCDSSASDQISDIWDGSFGDQSVSAKNELRQLINGWVKKHVSEGFYSVENITERIKNG